MAQGYIVTAYNAEGSDPLLLFCKFQASGEETNIRSLEWWTDVAEGLMFTLK